MRSSRSRYRRSGITLLELVISSTMLAVIGTSLGLVLRTTRVAWETNDSEAAAHHHANAVVMHFVRHTREVHRVVAITAASITLENRLGEQLTWTHQPVFPNGRSGVVSVNFSATPGQYPLAYDIRNLTFTGFQENAITRTTDPKLVRMVQVDATVELPGNAHRLQKISSRVWIRAW